MPPLGIELKRLRVERKWTQAFAAREIGIQQSYLSKLENSQFLPSEEVIDKLSLCYGVALTEFIPQTVQAVNPLDRFTKVAAFVLLLALLLWLCAQFELFYPETYFTYQAKQAQFWVVNVTQFYRGERFVEGDVIYEIVGERRVSRFENRVILVLSYLLALVGGVLLASKRFLNR
ncbi:helix-turn-helix transcriptional regulator [Pseudoalteromonas tunicata]|uniref:helix-turn-helix domain-containing protein n=1 Tax=Pseudoalteromonas tunicata TaxID=314281 RepID=UPI00273E6575|nr:helix-turn-helix transcriptional regulator [Pseudoalteromonas tunicata]MDP5213685.1 helix-turn-helix transcriptional regulator [Pseudoalteromonas tunicata]